MKLSIKMINMRFIFSLLIAELTLSFFLFTPYPSFSEETSKEVSREAWILLEKGKEFLEEKEYGKALNLFQNALNRKRGIYPEAEMFIGDVFFLEGEYDLAIFHYQNAYKLVNAFTIPSDKYVLLYRMAALYLQKKNYKDMAEKLNEIVSDSSLNKNMDMKNLQFKILSLYGRGGLNEVLKLYRFNENFTIDAYNQLGWFYYKTGRYRAAISSFLFSSISVLSNSIDYIREKDPDYSFENLYSLISVSLKYKSLSDYFSRYNLFGCLYELGAASYAYDYIKPARSIWKLLTNFKEAGKYRNLAERQLSNPWKEPYLENIRIK